MQLETQRLVIAHIAKGKVTTETLTDEREIATVERALASLRPAEAAARVGGPKAGSDRSAR